MRMSNDQSLEPSFTSFEIYISTQQLRLISNTPLGQSLCLAIDPLNQPFFHFGIRHFPSSANLSFASLSPPANVVDRNFVPPAHLVQSMNLGLFHNLNFFNCRSDPILFWSHIVISVHRGKRYVVYFFHFDFGRRSQLFLGLFGEFDEVGVDDLVFKFHKAWYLIVDWVIWSWSCVRVGGGLDEKIFWGWVVEISVVEKLLLHSGLGRRGFEPLLHLHKQLVNSLAPRSIYSVWPTQRLTDSSAD